MSDNFNTHKVRITNCYILMGVSESGLLYWHQPLASLSNPDFIKDCIDYQNQDEERAFEWGFITHYDALDILVHEEVVDREVYESLAGGFIHYHSTGAGAVDAYACVSNVLRSYGYKKYGLVGTSMRIFLPKTRDWDTVPL